MSDAPIPGFWICRTCGFRLQVRVVNMLAGKVTVDERLSRELCPNGHGLLDQQRESDGTAPAKLSMRARDDR